MVVVAVAGSPAASEAVRTLTLAPKEDLGLGRAAAKVAVGIVRDQWRQQSDVTSQYLIH